MSSIFSILIVVIICFFVIRKSTKQSPGSRNNNNTKGPAAKVQRPRGYTNYRPHKDIVSVSRDMGDRKGAALRDDRHNDWLARQLEEEHRAFKATSEMFDLKIEHASHCDAKLLEQFHRKNCTAEGIDLANGSTVVKKAR